MFGDKVEMNYPLVLVVHFSCERIILWDENLPVLGNEKDELSFCHVVGQIALFDDELEVTTMNHLLPTNRPLQTEVTPLKHALGG
jgi:hypothetical protein